MHMAKLLPINPLFFHTATTRVLTKKELGIWKNAGINPDGEWYIITKDFYDGDPKKSQ